MTVGEAMERAEELRPGSRVAARTRQRWLLSLIHISEPTRP